jgi:hypothetical protein
MEGSLLPLHPKAKAEKETRQQTAIEVSILRMGVTLARGSRTKAEPVGGGRHPILGVLVAADRFARRLG